MKMHKSIEIENVLIGFIPKNPWIAYRVVAGVFIKRSVKQIHDAINIGPELWCVNNTKINVIVL